MSSERKTVAVIVAFSILLVAIGFALLSRPASQEDIAAPVTLQLDPGTLQAKAAVLYDPTSGEILLNKHAEEQLPLASLTKLLTAYIALQHPDQTVTITASDLREEGDTGLRVGEHWDIQSLISFALVTSSNDAITAAARAASIDPLATAEVVQAIDLHQTFALNPTGLDFSSSTAGAYGSATDVAKLLSLLLQTHPDILAHTASAQSVFESLDGYAHVATSTGRSITDIPGLIAMKTGYTDLAGGNLAVAFDRGFNRPLVAVVLGSSVEGRFEDMRTIIEAVRSSGL